MSLDKDGQPHHAFNWHRNLKKSLESLLGICRGIVVDGVVNENEIVFLDTWLKENTEIAKCWPSDVLAARVRSILADGRVTAEEAADLTDTIAQIIGGTTYDIGTVSGMATRLPIDDVKRLQFRNALFCLTGKFIYGTRRKCEEAIIDRGGQTADTVTKGLDYLVIGTLASRDWAHTSHGRKIERAIEYRRNGSRLVIISEEIWTRHI